MLLNGLCGWVSQLAGLHVQIRPLGGLPNLLAVFPGRVVRLDRLHDWAGLYNHYWFDRIPGYVCFLTIWCLQLDSMLKWGLRQGSAVRQGLGLCLKFDRTVGCALKLAGSRTGLCNQVRHWLGSTIRQGLWLGSLVGRNLQLYPAVLNGFDCALQMGRFIV